MGGIGSGNFKKRREDLTGKIFSMAGVTAIEFHSVSDRGHAKWLFECNHCGKRKVVLAYHVKNGRGIGCGC